MIAALDVGYTSGAHSESGLCGVVAFEEWHSPGPAIELSVVVNDIKPYVSGRLFERELPCLVAGLEALLQKDPAVELTCVLVDGNVRLDSNGRPGLGHYLYRHLDERVPVIGVAKSAFEGLDAVEVLRGSSANPLFVTAAGIDEEEAGRLVAGMAGEFRLPTLIRRADQLTRAT